MSRSPLTRETVIADAAALADEAGFDEVTLSAVARRLGVQAPSLYSHVRDLAALRDGISALALAELGRRVALAIGGRSGRAALRGLADAHRGLARDRPGLWRSLQRRVGASVAAAPEARTLVALNDAVLDGYGLPQREHVHATRMIGSVVNGFLALESTGSFDHSDPAPDVSWARILDALDALLREWPSTEPTAEDPHA
ncbi:AcrR family transcriptional regulator [Diaminobutyricimonas aerilata]|uniref:AcrR family transcriptional regulator n=1 Tax=Diaminobutyricimonas aerilata TaxID=1162967 RepID=A0A2M9CFE7_9MICO|nr:TetR/AcrR family transcriptional regulator [Diaminobutyricimonas aerilata]PJJ70609.1 AcrR family transcriptional regulator [Diaminobutyricimonas aerilata]